MVYLDDNRLADMPFAAVLSSPHPEDQRTGLVAGAGERRGWKASSDSNLPGPCCERASSRRPRAADPEGMSSPDRRPGVHGPNHLLV